MVVRYLSAAELCGLHELITEAAGTEASLLDEGKLEAASLRPQNAAYYDAAALFEQAVVLITGIAPAHAFSDGNKRLALLADSTFLDLNGSVVRAPTHAFAEQILAIVSRDWRVALDPATRQLAAWLEKHAQPVENPAGS